MKILERVKSIFSTDKDSLVAKPGYHGYHNIQRRVFKDDALQKQIETKGYVVLPLLSDEMLKACLEIYKESDLDVQQEKYNTLEVNLEAHRRRIASKLEAILQKVILDKLDDYKIYGYNFAIKKANSQIRFNAHTDNISADEDKYTSINVWVPLVDADETNGALYMLEGSHKFDLPPRGLGMPFAFKEIQSIIEENARPLPVKAGNAIFFNSRMIHGSGENNTGVDRPAIIIGTAPKEAELLIYMNHDKIRHNEYEVFEIDESFFHKVVLGKRPDFAKSRGVFKYKPVPYDKDKILSIIQN